MDIRIKRIIAAYVDALFIQLPSMIIFGYLTQGRPTFAVSTAFIVAVVIIVLLRDVLCGGRSLGKRLLKLGVVSTKTNSKANIMQLVLRNVPMILLMPIEILFVIIQFLVLKVL